MARTKLYGLLRIRGNIAKLAKNKSEVSGYVKDIYAGFLDRGRRAFQKKLNSEAISEHFQNTKASQRLFKAFNTDIEKALKIKRDGTVEFKFFINPAGKRNDSDPTEYYEAIDTGKREPKGPSLDRIIQWLIERKIISSEDDVIETKSGPIEARAFAGIVMRTVRRRNAAREYKALHITQMLVDVIDIKNPSSDFRQSMLGALSNAVMGKTA